MLVDAADVPARSFNGGFDAFGKRELPLLEEAHDALGHGGFGKMIGGAAGDDAQRVVDAAIEHGAGAQSLRFG